MQTLKINYRSGRIRHYLVFTIIWLILGILSMFFNAEGFMKYGFIVIGLFYLALFIHAKSVPYIVFENEEIKINAILPKKVHLSEIKSIKEFAGDYTLHTETRKVRIFKNMMNVESFEQLKTFMNTLQTKLKN